MHLTTMMLARNEAWDIGLTARGALEWCDELIVFDHASTDRTHDLLVDLHREYGVRVRLLEHRDPVWHEMKYRQEMLEHARLHGATHCAVVDADEILTGNLLPEIRSAIAALGPRQSLEPPWVGIRGALDRYHANGIWGTNWVSTAFKMNPEWHWTARNGYDFHHRRPMGAPMSSCRPWKQSQGGLMHLQFVSDRRLRAKQACYKMQEVLRWPGREPVECVDKRYSPAVYGTPGDRLETVPAEWWKPYEKWMHYLDADAEPWQERQCRYWMAEYGAERFKGLDLFGVV